MDFYYPSDGKSVVVDDRGHVNRAHNRALVLNGTDSLGSTSVDITRNGLHFASAGGIDNSTSTRAGYRTARYGAGAAVTAVLGVAAINAASSAYGANQAQVASSNASAAKLGAANAAAKASAAKLPVVGTSIPAQTTATVTVPVAPATVPAAGSTINAVVPATVVPVAP